MDDRQIIRKDIDGICRWGNGINQRLVDFISYLRRLADEIGADGETAHVFIEYERGWYDEGDDVVAYVYRDETDAEATARVAQAEAASRAQEARVASEREQRERAEFERLKSKYGA